MRIFNSFYAAFFLFCAVQSFAQQNTLPNNTQQREVSWVNPYNREMEGLSHRILKSDALGRDVGYVVWTPSGYDQNPGKRYPVLYFLHGLGGNERNDAPSFTRIVQTAINDGLMPPVICVFPNGGVQWYQGEIEKMIIDELLPTIDRDFHTLAKAQSRALTGFSMGGYGSVYLSVMHPDLFCAAGSLGGRFRSNEQYLAAIEKAIPAWKNSNYGFFFVNGDNDRPEEFKNLAANLEKNGIDNVIIVQPDTDHDLGKYYSGSSGELFKLLKAHIKTE